MLLTISSSVAPYNVHIYIYMHTVGVYIHTYTLLLEMYLGLNPLELQCQHSSHESHIWLLNFEFN